jgi:coenzyme F420 hydrogenase subunit beta
MKHLPSVSFTTSNQLCTGCGICEDICPKGAIKFSVVNAINIPIIDDEKCINDKGCSRCFQVCSGVGIDIRKQYSDLDSDVKNNFDYYIGNYVNCYAGHSTNYDIRYHSASGGMITQLLLYLLEKRLINGAVVTKFKVNAPTQPETIIATSKEEIISGKSSKYCPVSLNGISSKIKKLEGKFVIVGLPCHIQGFRKYEQKDHTFKEKIFGYFSIFCSSTRTFNGTEYHFSRYGIQISEIKEFAYRDDGCLGFMKVLTETHELKIPFREYYHKLRSFFKPKRCLYCIDHFGDLADLNFGDIQIGKYKKDKIGVNSIISRNSYFDDLLNNAYSAGVVTLEQIKPSVLKNSQHMLKHKRKIAGLNIRLEKKLGNKTPTYDISLPSNYALKDYLIYFSIKVQRYLGAHKSLWPLIDIYNKILLRLS